MGLRDLFRSNKHDTPRPQPSPGARPSDPAADRAPGSDPEAAPQQGERGQDAPRRRTEPEATPLPESGALRNLVELLLSRGAHRARLTLVQSGNIMTHQTRQAVGDAQDEVENGTVDQGSPLFDDVADLYTQAMSTPVGPWRQLDLVVSAPDGDRRDITVTYDFPNGESRTEHYAHGRARSDAAQQDPGAVETTAGADHERSHGADRGDHERTGGAAAGGLAAGGAAGASLGAAGTRDADDADRQATTGSVTADDTTNGANARRTAGGDGGAAHDDAVRVVDHERAEPAADGDVVAGGHTTPVVVAGTEAPEHGAAATPGDQQRDHTTGASEHPGTAAGAAQAHELQDAPLDATDPHGSIGDPEDEAHRGSEDLDRPTETVDTGHPASAAVADPMTGQPGVVDPTGEPFTGETSTAGAQELPAHVDESAFGADSAESLVPPAVTEDDDDPAGAPQLATATDVAPSYRAPAPEQELDPNALAPGNLTLTVGDVVSRLADAQRHLFGPEGTARDVSTVLIRVRALGTYYDALTHVRLNGFWDQRPTFDLVPEEQLRVQELKDDSYVEGSGAPLAMMFRFRPGVPPEVTFDYSDEEAFVRYEQRLPGQNYLEELRMYPRTGSNIPQHVNEALQDWNY
ncbi:hypothetical protein [Kocuria tytonis]|uniref:Uncharacterized protein n=1 Tax=Kocuria tytonis TaxID=2054280 RepID=A0A495A4H3_9MICC|nr:hypothetical protein [Kocuria tytonis]RKQ34109.1 hypothetical protein C1C97_009680 [Kocuria tytonis]